MNRISIIKGSLRADFLDEPTYIKKYGSNLTEYQRQVIATRDNVFLRMFGTEAGFFGLTQNNSITVSGIDQDGSDFQSNYYSERQVTWQFEWYRSCSSILDAIVYQDDELLTIEVASNVGTFYNNTATLASRFEGGIFELLCSDPNWSIKGKIYESCAVIPVVKSEIELIDESQNKGFLVNSFYFGSGTLINIKTYSVTFTTRPIFTISGNWQNMILKNKSSGSELHVNTSCLSSCIVDCTNLTVTVDGIDVTKSCKGFFPILYSGPNDIEYNFEVQLTDVKACVKYDVKKGSIDA